MPIQMFFSHNTALVPPYNCLVDTNFITYGALQFYLLLILVQGINFVRLLEQTLCPEEAFACTI